MACPSKPDNRQDRNLSQRGMPYPYYRISDYLIVSASEVDRATGPLL